MKAKIITGISLLVFFGFTTLILTAGLTGYYKDKEQKSEQAREQIFNNKLADASAEQDPAIAGALTLNEIEKHSTKQDCWMIIDGNVYDLTSFIDQHPGGGKFILGYCGKDGTEGFNTRDKNPVEKHSSFARNLLRSYYVGPVGREPENLLVPGSQNPIADPSNPNNLLKSTPSQNNLANNSNVAVLDMTEVSKHSTLQNCWMVISGNIYDITSFVASHPGGETAIAPFCGKEATNAFSTKGRSSGSNHSSYAYSLLSNFKIGTLGSSVPVNNSGNLAGNVNSNVPTVSFPTIAPTSPPAIANPTSIPQSNLTLTTSEVSSHNTLQNCWLIVSNNVYDVTSFIYQHPGGVSRITNYCGKESTSAFQTRGGGNGNHSSYAYSLLNNYLIGSLGSSVPVNNNPTSIPSSGNNSNPTSAPSTSEGSSSLSLPQAITNKYPGATRRSGSYEDDGRWEGKVDTTSGCREIKVNSSGSISEDKSC